MGEGSQAWGARALGVPSVHIPRLQRRSASASLRLAFRATRCKIISSIFPPLYHNMDRQFQRRPRTTNYVSRGQVLQEVRSDWLVQSCFSSFPPHLIPTTLLLRPHLWFSPTFSLFHVLFSPRLRTRTPASPVSCPLSPLSFCQVSLLNGHTTRPFGTTH